MFIVFDDRHYHPWVWRVATMVADVRIYSDVATRAFSFAVADPAAYPWAWPVEYCAAMTDDRDLSPVPGYLYDYEAE